MTPEKKRASRHAYYLKHRQHEIATAKEWNANHHEQCLELRKEHHRANRASDTQYNRERRQSHLPFHLSVVIGKRLNRAARDFAFPKCAKAKELLGCTIGDLINHLESKFVLGMSWENYGPHGWHMDHIRPCFSFDLTDPEQQRVCFHYTNIQPLWATENRKKGNRYGLTA